MSFLLCVLFACLCVCVCACVCMCVCLVCVCVCPAHGCALIRIFLRRRATSSLRQCDGGGTIATGFFSDCVSGVPPPVACAHSASSTPPQRRRRHVVTLAGDCIVCCCVRLGGLVARSRKLCITTTTNTGCAAPHRCVPAQENSRRCAACYAA